MKKEVTIFDNPKNVKRLLWFFYIVLAALLAADFFIVKHGHFPWEDHAQFFAAYGFVACVMVIFISQMRMAVVSHVTWMSIPMRGIRITTDSPQSVWIVTTPLHGKAVHSIMHIQASLSPALTSR